MAKVSYLLFKLSRKSGTRYIWTLNQCFEFEIKHLHSLHFVWNTGIITHLMFIVWFESNMKKKSCANIEAIDIDVQLNDWFVAIIPLHEFKIISLFESWKCEKELYSAKQREHEIRIDCRYDGIFGLWGKKWNMVQLNNWVCWHLNHSRETASRKFQSNYNVEQRNFLLCTKLELIERKNIYHHH